MNTNQSTVMGQASPQRQCIWKRMTDPVCFNKVKITVTDDLGNLVEALGLCRGCKRHKQMKAAAARQRQMRLAHTRNLKAVNDNLNIELDAHEFIQGETETERFRLKSMIARKLAEIEELRKRKEAMVMAYNYRCQL